METRRGATLRGQKDEREGTVERCETKRMREQIRERKADGNEERKSVKRSEQGICNEREKERSEMIRGCREGENQEAEGDDSLLIMQNNTFL